MPSSGLLCSRLPLGGAEGTCCLWPSPSDGCLRTLLLTIQMEYFSHIAPLVLTGSVIDGKLAPFLSKVIKFASSHVYSCSLCREKGFVCELCQNGQILYPFQESTTKRCEGCGAVFHAECRMRAQPCPRCVRRELHTKPSSFWRRHNHSDSPDDELLGCFELDT